MKIALMNKKSNYYDPVNLDQYNKDIREVIQSSGADLIVGPELALGNSSGVRDKDSLLSFIASLQEDLAHSGSCALVVPGTGLVKDCSRRVMYNRAFSFDADNVWSFDKQSSVVESDVAKNLGLTYTSVYSPHVFSSKSLGGRLALVSICRDHGLGEARNSGLEADVEIVIAANLKGINPQKSAVRDKGLVVFVDGTEPKRNCVYSLENNNIEILPSVSKGTYELIEVTHG